MKKKTIKSFDDTRISYLINRPKNIKNKTFVIFLHGWMSNSSYFKKYFELFEKKKIPFIAIDMRGHGYSESPEEKNQYELYLMAKDIKLVMEAEEVEKAIVLGHSMGGMVALEFYDMWPEKVKSLILCNTSYRGPLRKDITWDTANKKLKKIFNAAFKKEQISEKIVEEMGFEKPVKVKSVVFVAMKILEFNDYSVLGKINTPTLIIAAEHDEYFSKDVALKMKKEIKKSKLIFCKTNHDAPRKEFSTVSKNILEFIKKH